MSKQVDIADRLLNDEPPTDPLDKSLLNADNINLIADNILSGKYRRVLPKYAYADIVALADKELGEEFYVTDMQMKALFVGISVEFPDGLKLI